MTDHERLEAQIREVLASENNGYATGNYGLSIQRLVNPNLAVPLTIGTNTTGHITVLGGLRTYILTLNR